MLEPSPSGARPTNHSLSQPQYGSTYTYDPYGNLRTSSGGEASINPLRYTSQYTDPTSAGLYHNAARYYDPTTGRFTQADPAGYETNPYAYARNCPSTFDDPTGLDATDCNVAATLQIGSYVGVALAFATGPVGLVAFAVGTAALSTYATHHACRDGN